MSDQTELYPMGDMAIIVQFGWKIDVATHQKIRVFCRYLDTHPFHGMIEYVPAFTTVTIYYDPLMLSYANVERVVTQYIATCHHADLPAGRTVHIPVCYGGEFGPDIEDVAEHNGLSVDEVVSIHTGGEYLVYMIGFAPGFPYLGGLSQQLATPRLTAPRLEIPAGAVGIAGEQTGIYPIGTPGGWRLIGRTPLALFRPNQTPPSLLAAADIVRFYAISEDDFHGILKSEEWQ